MGLFDKRKTFHEGNIAFNDCGPIEADGRVIWGCKNVALKKDGGVKQLGSAAWEKIDDKWLRVTWPQNLTPKELNEMDQVAKRAMLDKIIMEESS